MAKEPGKIAEVEEDKPQTEADVDANSQPLPDANELPPPHGDTTSSNGDANVRGLHGRDGSANRN